MNRIILAGKCYDRCERFYRGRDWQVATFLVHAEVHAAYVPLYEVIVPLEG